MARSISCYGWNSSVSEVWRVLIGAYVFAGLAQLVLAADNPESALLEFLGATSRLEAAGVDVEAFTTQRLDRKRLKLASITVPENTDVTVGPMEK